MSWFQLGPSEIAERARARGEAVRVPSLAESVGRGALGFMLVSVAGFAPWALAGRPLHRAIGEAGLYAVCAVVFIGLSAVFLHRLIIGPGSLLRFYKVFGIGFALYSVAWIIGWMSLRGHLGSLLGLWAGTAVMAWVFTRAFDAKSAWMKCTFALFVLNSLGYFSGGWVEASVSTWTRVPLVDVALDRSTRRRLAMLLWGVFYGLGLGAGLGLTFYYCQKQARRLLSGKLGVQ